MQLRHARCGRRRRDGRRIAFGGGFGGVGVVPVGICGGAAVGVPAGRPGEPAVGVEVELTLARRDDYGGVGGTGHVQCGAAHVDDLRDRLGDGDEGDGQPCGREQRGGGDGRRARHADGADRHQQRQDDDHEVLPRCVVEPLRVDGEYRKQRRPHARAARHSQVGAESGHERGGVLGHAGGAQLTHRDRDRADAALRGEGHHAGRPEHPEEAQRAETGCGGQNQRLDDEHLDRHGQVGHTEHGEQWQQRQDVVIADRGGD